MKELDQYGRIVQFMAFVVYGAGALILMLLYSKGVLSWILGGLTGLLNFRLQVRAMLKFKEKPGGSFVPSYMLRFLIIGVVLFLSFLRQPVFNPYVVFAAIVGFNLIIIAARFFQKQ